MRCKIDFFLGSRHNILPDRSAVGRTPISTSLSVTPSSLHTPPTLIGALILAPSALELGLLPHLLILEPHCLVPHTSFKGNEP